MVIGVSQELALPMEGTLPPDLQGMLFRVGPRRAAVGRGGSGGGGGAGGAGGAGGEDVVDGPGGEGATPSEPRGALHAIEIRDGKAVSYVRRESEADAGVFWHAGSVLALPEAGLPSRYSRFLEPQEFAGGLTVPIASHAHRVAADGSRVLFAVDDGFGRAGGAGAGTPEPDGIWLRIGEWDATGELRSAQSVELERATWQHDIGVTANHVVFIESPTTRLAGAADDSAIPFAWVPGAEGWMGVVRRGEQGADAGGGSGDGDGDGDGDRDRDGRDRDRDRDRDGGGVRWFRLDPCLVTHVLGAAEMEAGRRGGGEGRIGATPDPPIVVYVCRYEAPEAGRPVDLSASVVGPDGIGLSSIGDSLAVLERWRIVGDRVERMQLDERHVEYPRIDALCEGVAFRYGYCVEMTWGESNAGVSPGGILKFDLDRDDVTAWNPGPWRRATEPVFVHAGDGGGDDEGWLLTVVDDASDGSSALYVLDASTLGRRGPDAVIHLPERLPLRSHGEWVPADRYR